MTSPPLLPSAHREAGGTRAAVLAATVLLLAAVGATALHLDNRIGALDVRLRATQDTLRATQDTLRLMRLEAGSAGKGPGALIEQIEKWAPDLGSSATPAPALHEIRERLDEVLAAVDALGPDAYEAFVARLEDTSAELSVETRKWLLRAAVRADPDRGLQLLSSVLRGNRLQPSARLRFVAADDLAERDRDLAGEVLHQVLTTESHSGMSRQPPPELAPEYERHIENQRFPDYFNLIPRYVATGHHDVEATLLMLLGREEHDRMTYQECIRQLGKLGSRRAVDRIKELFVEMPRREFNPLFQNVCLQALADILGSDACPWFQEQLRTTDTELVANKLRELVKQLCS